ncbi:transglycosylase domain-containing protein [Haloimpatiens sp. FM7315]|uniref:transglycosylase domain-containing protein n=1 Tax=Haloimpatiens sp. FM7315 TaxID=3298609 RepID=UPI0039773153
MTKKKKPVKKKGRKFFKTLFLSIFLLILLASVAFGGIVLAMIKTSPSLNINEILVLNETSKLYDDKDEFMDNIISEQKRTPVKSSEIPINLKHAFVSIEDERFYKHKGVDPKRVLGAFVIDIKNKITGNKNLQGASTITQQLIKNSVLTPEVSIKRKVQEMYLSVSLEKHLSKDQILEAYLNTIYLGRGAFGVGAASERYFSKNIKDLSLIQCAYIAGVTQSPSVYDAYSPKSKKDPSIYLNRTKTVLGQMYKNKYITKAEYDSAIEDINNNKLAFNPSKDVDKMQYEWFSRQVINEVKKDLKSAYGYDDNQVSNILMQGGLKIYTTMNKDIQNNTQDVLNNMSSLLGIRSVYENQIIQPQAAAVIMDYHTGDVKAIVGGKGDQPPMSLNRATSALNPCGSSIKPLSVYSPAIDNKTVTPATIIDDNPLPENFKNSYSGWDPKNSPRTYDGKITVRQGLKKSKNVVAAQIEDMIGVKTGASYAEKFGINLTSRDKSSIAAISLGEIEGTTPLKMASAYGTFGNNGVRTHSRLYRKVVDRTGKIILQTKTETTKILSPASSYIVYDMLKEPPTYSGTNANFSPMVRGKTGTTTDSKDLWFCGLTPYYSASVWIGDDKNKDFNNSSSLGRKLGSNDAALLWGKIMKYAHKDLAFKTIDKPSDVEEVSICSISGKLAGPFCKETNSTFSELFLRGTAPFSYCDIHKSLNSTEKEDTKKEDEKEDKTKVPIEEKTQKNDKNNDTNDNNNDTNTEDNTTEEDTDKPTNNTEDNTNNNDATHDKNNTDNNSQNNKKH